MRLAVTLAATFALAACAAEQTPEQKAAADAAAVAEVKANLVPPPEALAPEEFVFADYERYNLFGAGCNFVPEGSDNPVALAQADRGYLKRSGELLTMAADKGSAENPLGSWRKYSGKDYTMTLDLGADGKQNGMETVDYAAELVVSDGRDQTVYRAQGTAQCGS